MAGGMDAYFAVSPLTDKDKKARISKVVQPQAGVKVRTRFGHRCALAPCLPACPPFCIQYNYANGADKKVPFLPPFPPVRADTCAISTLPFAVRATPPERER